MAENEIAERPAAAARKTPRETGLPPGKTLETSDFEAVNGCISKAQVMALAGIDAG